jgi:hypothetical protein
MSLIEYVYINTDEVNGANYSTWLSGVDSIQNLGYPVYLQITQVGSNNIIGIWRVISITSTGGVYEFQVDTPLVANGTITISDVFTISWVYNGISGSSGSSGSSGTSGSSGPSGAAGSSGTSGTSGTTGSSGTSGTSGQTGASGSAGTSGTSFTSPYSGNLNGTAGQSWMSSFEATTLINWNNGNVQTRTLAASETFTFANPQNGATYILVIKQAAAGNYTITWPTISWMGGAPPTMTATANKTDIYTFVYANSTYFGSYAQNF